MAAGRCPHILPAVIAGGKGKIAAFGAADGKEIWTAKVKGTVHGLAISNGLLIAATDTGAIYCFANKPAPAVGPTGPQPLPLGDVVGVRCSLPAEKVS